MKSIFGDFIDLVPEDDAQADPPDAVTVGFYKSTIHKRSRLRKEDAMIG